VTELELSTSASFLVSMYLTKEAIAATLKPLLSLLVQNVIEEKIRNRMRLWVKNPKRLLKETFLDQVFLGVLLHHGIEVLFFPEQVSALAVDVNNAGFLGDH
jgi:hypothetical protein